MICFDRVSKFILSDIGFSVPGGRLVGVIGASGAGKTTLLKLACGMLSPDEGRVRILGKEPVGMRKMLGKTVGACIGGIPLLEGEDTVEEGFRMLQSVYGMPREQYQRSYGELSERLGFGELAGSRCKDLSAGQRTRVRMGAALLADPAVLLLDEPTVGMDARGKAALKEILSERCGRGAAALVTSHDMAEVSGLCSRVVLLEKGRLLYYGDERTLLRRYAPFEEITVKLAGRFPDLEDMPLESYTLDGGVLRLRFRPKYITAAEILKQLLGQVAIQAVDVRRAGLEDVLLQIEKERLEHAQKAARKWRKEWKI